MPCAARRARLGVAQCEGMLTWRWQVARLLSAKDRGGMYLLEYTVQKPGEEQPRHFLSAVSLGYNGRHAALTAGCATRCGLHALPRCASP